MRFGIRTKMLVFTAVAWTFIFGAYGVYVYKERIEQTRRMALANSDIQSREIVADLQVYTSEVIKKAREAGLEVTADYRQRERAIPLHTIFLKEVMRTIALGEGFSVGFKSFYPINPGSLPVDDFQKNALEAFSAGVETMAHSFEEVDGRESIRYMVPAVATSGTCVECHNTYPGSPRTDYEIGDVIGALEVVVPIESEMVLAMADIWRAIGYGFIVVVTMAFIGLWFIRRVIPEPVLDVVDITRHLAMGDLTGTAAVKTSDEIGELARTTNEVVTNLHRMIEDIRRTSDEAFNISSAVREMSRYVLDGSRKQASSIDSIVSRMEDINTSISDMAGAADVLAGAVEKGSSSVLELGSNINEVVDNADLLASSVDETARSTSEMSASIKDISGNMEQLSEAITQVSSSMGRMSAMVRDVEVNAGEGYRFADEVIKDAKAGMETVDSTIRGIVRIKDVTRESSEIISNLRGRIKQIGKILDVIRDVAEETNLLAINAAIIAAQSGEEGKSFSVVANEKKDLAERTSSSAKEVTEIIQAVETESERAGEVMGRGVESVEEGVRLSMEAGEDLRKIVTSAQRSTTSVREIARASAEQAAETGIVVESTEKVDEMTRKVVSSAREQARGSELIKKASERMAGIAYKVKNSSEAQLKASRQITATVEDRK